MARNADVEKEIDRLYAAPPGEFVRRRDELARSLRAEGEREAADEVKKLRKPTVAAWAVNQLARREKMRVRGLLTAGERLRGAHEELLKGGASDGLERARDDERAAIEELAGAARRLLEEAGHPPTETVLDRLRETLHAAAVDEAVGERVRAGRLEKEEKATGFGFTGLPAGKVGARKPAAKPARDDARRKRRRQAEERLREARAAVAAAEREVAGRRRELEAAERALASRRADAERAERELERAG
jgi:hypothetical protein